MTLANSFAAKLSVAFVAFATAFVLAVPAQAAEMSDADMEAEIARLTALIGDLTTTLGGDTTGGSMSSSTVCPYAWTRSLSVGDSGADVMKLQQFLNADAMTRVAATGVGSAGMETEYYGGLTGAAVAKFQEANRAAILSPLGLVNSTTFFGPSTMAEANAQCASAPVVVDDTVADDTTTDDTTTDDDDTTSTATLGSGEGDIDSVSEVSGDESSLEENMEGGVLGFEVSIEGDVEIDRIDVYASEDGADSEDAADYFNSASLWVDGEKIATIDVDDFDQDDYTELGNSGDDYRLRFSGLGLVFTDGDEPEFQVGFEAVNNIDSGDITGDWDVALHSIRFVDGVGFTDSWEDGADPLVEVIDNFGFDAEETAELEVSSSSDDPDATTLEVDADDDTEKVTVFAFEVEETGGVDVEIDDLTVTLSTDDDDIVTDAYIYDSSDNLLDSQSVSGAGAIAFENMDFALAADASEDLFVKFTFDGLTGNFAEGATVTVEFTSLDDFVDDNGNDENDITPTGSASGEEHTLRTEGLSLSALPTDGDGSGDSTSDTQDTVNNSTGEMFLEFTVTAFGDDLYIPTDMAERGASTTAGVAYTIEDSGTATSGGAVSLTYDVEGATESNGYFELEKDVDYTMVVNVNSYNPTDTGTYNLQILTIGYNDSPAEADSTEAPADIEDYESDDVTVQS